MAPWILSLDDHDHHEHHHQNHDSNENNQAEIVSPGMQKVTAVLCVITSVCMISLGALLFTIPSYVIPIFFACLSDGEESDSYGKEEFYDNNDNTLNIVLSRMAGSTILSQGLASVVLSLPILSDWWSSRCVFRTMSVNQCRVAVSTQAISGLLFVLLGLLDDRINRNEKLCDAMQSEWLLGIGAFLLVLSCIAMMLSFFPIVQPTNSSSNNNNNSNNNNIDNENYLLVSQSNNRHGSLENSNQDEIDNNNIIEPLLFNDENTSDYQLLLNNTENDHNIIINPTEEQSNDNDNNNNDTQITSRIRGTRRLLKLAAPQVFYLYVGCVVLLIRLPFSLSIPHFVSTTLSSVSRGDFGGARREILLLFMLGTIDAALDFWCIFLFGYANQRIVRGVRIDTFMSILKQEIGFFDNHTSGELSSRLNSDCGEMAGDLTWFFRFSIESVVRISGITAYMLIRSPTLGAYALCVIPVVAAVNKYYGNWLSKNASEVQDALAKANSVAQEAFACIRTVIAFASEEYEYQKYVNKVDHQYRLNIRQLYMTGIYYMAISTFLINTVVQATLLLIGAHMIEQGRLTGEILLAFMLYQGQLQSETMNLFQSYSSLIKSSGAGDKVFELLDRTPPPPGTGNNAVTSSESTTIGNNDRSPCSVLLENIQFAYPSRSEQRVLKDLTLNIPQGHTVALVGSSGCGKSTIVSLLQRFYDPSEGRILIDDTDIKTLDIKHHRRRIGVVTQDPTLFGGTILSNIIYGCLGATREEAIEAAKLANAHGFVSSFPNGYETEVGERGVQLSGGQKQRIAISRAIVRNPSLLLLDEATSALDAESEQVVQEALDRLLNINKEITTMIVAHRLRTVRNADLIAVVQNGAIVEVGSHRALIEQDGYYRKMVDASMGGTLVV